jgi:hypothetical protein
MGVVSVILASDFDSLAPAQVCNAVQTKREQNGVDYRNNMFEKEAYST